MNTEKPAHDSYDDLWNAFSRVETAAVSLPTFEVIHEGGIKACTQNIVEAITRATAAIESASSIGMNLDQQDLVDALKSALTESSVPAEFRADIVGYFCNHINRVLAQNGAPKAGQGSEGRENDLPSSGNKPAATGAKVAEDILGTSASELQWRKRSADLLEAVHSALSQADQEYSIEQLVESLSAGWIESAYIRAHKEAESQGANGEWTPHMLRLRRFVETTAGLDTGILINEGALKQHEGVYERHHFLVTILVRKIHEYTSSRHADAAKNRLAAFGAMVLQAHRRPYPDDVDGGTLQELAVRAGVLEPRRVTERCGENCQCAEVGAIPGDCYFTNDAVFEWLKFQANPESHNRT